MKIRTVHQFMSALLKCSRTITLKDNVIIKLNDGNHNHEPKLPENVQKVFCGLKRRVLSDIDQSVTKIYEEELKKFVSACLFQLY